MSIFSSALNLKYALGHLYKRRGAVRIGAIPGWSYKKYTKHTKHASFIDTTKRNLRALGIKKSINPLKKVMGNG
jgi:hypothetical protein